MSRLQYRCGLSYSRGKSKLVAATASHSFSEISQVNYICHDALHYPIPPQRAIAPPAPASRTSSTASELPPTLSAQPHTPQQYIPTQYLQRDPPTARAPTGNIIVKFYNYGPRHLHSILVLEAINDAIKVIQESDQEEQMEAEEWKWEDDAGDVVILLHPQPHGTLTWTDWRVAIKGLLHFERTYDSVEMYVDIFEEEIGLIATGALSEW